MKVHIITPTVKLVALTVWLHEDGTFVMDSEDIIAIKNTIYTPDEYYKQYGKKHLSRDDLEEICYLMKFESYRFSWWPEDIVTRCFESSWYSDVFSTNASTKEEFEEFKKRQMFIMVEALKEHMAKAGAK